MYHQSADWWFTSSPLQETGSLLRPYLVVEPDHKRFLINTTLLVMQLFCGSLVNYGGYLVLCCGFKSLRWILEWHGFVLANTSCSLSGCQHLSLSCDAARWNASLSIICSSCSVTGTWCLDFFFVQMRVRPDFYLCFKDKVISRGIFG